MGLACAARGLSDRWMEACLKSELPSASELENSLRNGVIVGRLAMFFAPEVVKQRQIYDFDEAVYKVKNEVSKFSCTPFLAFFSLMGRSMVFVSVIQTISVAGLLRCAL